MNRKTWAAITVMVAAMLASAGLAWAGGIGGSTPACQASQPVYAGTAHVGSWTVTLHAGQSVPLPDGDTLTCTAAGPSVH